MNTNLNRTRTAVSVVALVSVAGLVLPASGADATGRTVTRSGSCSTLGTWTMKAAAEAPRMIGVEFGVDTNVPRQRFQVRVVHNGTQLASIARATRAPSGSFTVHNVVPNRAGVDRFSASATRVGGGNTCAARIRF